LSNASIDELIRRLSAALRAAGRDDVADEADNLIDEPSFDGKSLTLWALAGRVSGSSDRAIAESAAALRVLLEEEFQSAFRDYGERAYASIYAVIADLERIGLHMWKRRLDDAMAGFTSSEVCMALRYHLRALLKSKEHPLPPETRKLVKVALGEVKASLAGRKS